jgi:F-type H+-transporting ATPase subunit a
MEETGIATPELPNFIDALGKIFPEAPWTRFLSLWENVIFSLIAAFVLIAAAYFGLRRKDAVPSGLANGVEFFVEGFDAFARGMLGEKGARFAPFIGTLFIYIILMNLSGLIPFMKSSTSSWSTTLALALVVFAYVQYTAVRELGLLGYLDHLAGNPRGAIAFTVVLPVFMLVLHVISELIKPVSLSLRLRSNIWGDDVLLAVLTSFGLAGLPLLFFNMLMAVLTAVVQAVVFCMLTTVYFALVMPEREETEVLSQDEWKAGE